MKIAFFAESCVPFHAKSLDERALGGTETGVIRVAEILAEKGHEVFVFTQYQIFPESIPVYKPVSSVYMYQPFDVFISVQNWKSFFYNINSF